MTRPWKTVLLMTMVLLGVTAHGWSLLSATVQKTRPNVISTQDLVVQSPVSSPSMALVATFDATRTPGRAGRIRKSATFPMMDGEHRQLDDNNNKKKKKNKDKDQNNSETDADGEKEGDDNDKENEDEDTENADEVSDAPSPFPTVVPSLSPTLKPSSRPSSLPPTFMPTLSPSPPPTFPPVANDNAVDPSRKTPKEEIEKESTEGTPGDSAVGTEDKPNTEDEKETAEPQESTSVVPLTPFQVQLLLPVSVREESVNFELLESITTKFLLSYLQTNLEEGAAEAKSLRLVMTEFSTPDGTSQIPRRRGLWRGFNTKAVILRDMLRSSPTPGNARTSVSANFLVLSPQQEKNSEQTVFVDPKVSLSLSREDRSTEEQSVFMISITYEGDVYFLNEEDTTVPNTVAVAIEQVDAFRDEKQDYLRALRTDGKDDALLSSVVDANTEFPNIKSPGSENGKQPTEFEKTDSNSGSGGGSDPIVIISVLVGLAALGAAGLFAFYALRRMRANRRRKRSSLDVSKIQMDFGASPSKTSPDEEDDEDYDDNSSRMPNKSATSTISSKPSMAAPQEQASEIETSHVSEESHMEPPSPALKVAAAILQEQSQRHARGQTMTRAGRMHRPSASRSRSRSRGVGAEAPHVIGPADDDIKSMLTFDSMDAYSLEGGNHSANNSILAGSVGEDSDNESGAIVPYGGHGALAVYSYDGMVGHAGMVNLNVMSQARLAVYAAGDASSSDGESGIDDGVASRTNLTVHSGSDGGSQFTFSQIGVQGGGPTSASSLTATKTTAFSASVPAAPGIPASRTEDESDGIEVSIDGGIKGDLSDADAAAGGPADDTLDESDIAGTAVEADEDDKEFHADTKMFDEDDEGSDLRDVLSSPASSRGASRSRSRSRSIMSRIFSAGRGLHNQQQQQQRGQQQQPARAVTPNTQTTSSSLDSPPMHASAHSTGFNGKKENVDKIMANTHAMMSNRSGRGNNMSVPSRRVLDLAAVEQEAENDVTTIPLDARSASEVPSDELNSRVPLPQLTSQPSYEEPPPLIPRSQHNHLKGSYHNNNVNDEDVESSAVLDDLNRLSNLLRARKRESRGTQGSSVSRSRSRAKGNANSSDEDAPPPPATRGFASANTSPRDSYRNRLV